MTKPMPRIHLFIDTNVLLNFYHFADDSLEQLEQLASMINDVGICLHIPQQVLNELTRNREAKLKAANDQFMKEPLPSAVPRHMQQYAQSAEYAAAIDQAKKLRSQLVSLALADASNETLASDGLIRAVTEKATIYPEDQGVFAVALQRMQKGNPPGKSGSVGDQFNWETLLKEVPDGDLHIVSKDGDYASLLNKSRPHPSLEAEWGQKKGGHIHIYGELRAFLRKYNELLAQVPPVQQVQQPAEEGAAAPAIEPPALPPNPIREQIQPAQVDVVEEVNPEKEEAIQMLISSGSFASTHAAISRLAFFRAMLRRSDAERLIRAAVDNDQIRWIATDSDVYGFFASLLTEHSDIDNDLFEQAVDVFGLRPEPSDPFDDI
nr:PIN domain-containing protein [uncultured Duganella sp.]